MEKKASKYSISEILTGRFLISPRIVKHWPYVAFISFLALIMTSSSHNAERKVHQINELRTEMKQLHSEFIDMRSRLMSESMETKVLARAADLELTRSEQPPKKIIVTE
jgi:hypothetical protein